MRLLSSSIWSRRRLLLPLLPPSKRSLSSPCDGDTSSSPFRSLLYPDDDGHLALSLRLRTENGRQKPQTSKT